MVRHGKARQKFSSYKTEEALQVEPQSNSNFYGSARCGTTYKTGLKRPVNHIHFYIADVRGQQLASCARFVAEYFWNKGSQFEFCVSSLQRLSCSQAVNGLLIKNFQFSKFKCNLQMKYKNEFIISFYVLIVATLGSSSVQVNSDSFEFGIAFFIFAIFCFHLCLLFIHSFQK